MATKKAPKLKKYQDGGLVQGKPRATAKLDSLVNAMPKMKDYKYDYPVYKKATDKNRAEIEAERKVLDLQIKSLELKRKAPKLK